MTYVEYAVVASVFTPILAAPIALIAGRLYGRRAAEAVAVLASFVVLLSSILVWHSQFNGELPWRLRVPWLSGEAVVLTFLVDTLSRLFNLIVALIGFLVILYSVEYMSRDPGYARYYAFMLLFIGSMEGLVLTSNLGAAYVFWEAVGLCSFALIAHYYESPRASLAGVKALITTRLADVAFFAGVAYAYAKLGRLDYFALTHAPPSVYATIAALAFIGAVGKSAQLPLHVWLPDAMEGPTPVSALIHAATMVKAGVYIVARLALLAPVETSLPEVIAAVGAATAVYAALCAMAQYDAKRLLAYSTISQLGYMFAVLGSALAGAAEVDAALAHVASHAIFKALLFLVVGVVIHELEPLLGPEVARDLRHTAGALRGTPLVAASLLAGALSLAGIPPFAGAWSKEELIAAVYNYNRPLGILLLLASVATAFYAIKLAYTLVAATPPEESVIIRHVPPAMTIPILVLAVLTLASPLLIGWPEIHVEILWAASGLAAALTGVLLALMSCRRRLAVPSALYKLALEGFYIDIVYRRFIVAPLRALFTFLSRGILAVIDAGVTAGATAASSSSESLSSMHTGRISLYIASFILGLLVVIVAALASG